MWLAGDEPDASRDFREEGDRGGCNPPLFDHLLGKTDGLHAHRSDGDHERRVDLILEENFGNLSQRPLHKPAGSGN